MIEGLPSNIWTDPGLDGKYRFERHLASSLMAVVVVARHLELDERVAIKFLSPEALRSPAAVARFRREARAAAKIKNQHVVRIIDVAATETGIPYIVMELLEGKDLERLLAEWPERRASIANAIDFILQAAEAVIEGHTLGIVHRDLKPANLFCVDRGDGYPMIKVLDFGISKFTTALGDVDHTDQHEILGSPRYMSPEQITGAWSVDQRTDIWSLGVILYEALAGVPPFKDSIIPELWRKIRSEAPVSLKQLRPEIPEGLEEVVSKCLEKESSKRYGDLSELARDLAPFAPERSRASIARIRFTIDSSNDSSTRPSSYSDPAARPSSGHRAHKNRRSRLLYGGMTAAAVGLAVGWFTNRIAHNPYEPRAQVQLAAPRELQPPPVPTAAPLEPAVVPVGAGVVASTTLAPAPLATATTAPRSPSPGPTPTRVSSNKASRPPPVASEAPAPPAANPAASTRAPVWLVPPISARK